MVKSFQNGISLDRQNGFTVLLVMIAILGIISTIYAGYEYRVSFADKALQLQTQNQYIHQIGASVDDWYNRNAAIVDGNALAIAPATIITQSSLPVQYGLQVVSSNRIIANGIGYHVIVAYLPDDAGVSALDPATGIFTPASPKTVFYITNGMTIETQNLITTASTLSRLSGVLETWFIGMENSMPISHRSQNDWFLMPMCAAADSMHLACTGGFIDANPVLSAVGLISNGQATDAWGNAILIDNSTSLAVAPFSIFLKSNTPWGTTSQISAVGLQ